MPALNNFTPPTYFSRSAFGKPKKKKEKKNTKEKTTNFINKHYYHYFWVRGVMELNVGCEFRDQGSIPSEYLIPRDVDLWQVNLTIVSVASS